MEDDEFKIVQSKKYMKNKKKSRRIIVKKSEDILPLGDIASGRETTKAVSLPLGDKSPDRETLNIDKPKRKSPTEFTKKEHTIDYTVPSLLNENFTESTNSRIIYGTKICATPREKFSKYKRFDIDNTLSRDSYHQTDYRDKNKKRILCCNYVTTGECPYGSNCVYAHSLQEQNIDPLRRKVYDIINSNALLNDIDLVHDIDLYKTFLQLTRTCYNCEKKICMGGYNCKNGAIDLTHTICYNDLYTGNCKYCIDGKECPKIHLTKRQLIPKTLQIMIMSGCTEKNKSEYIKQLLSIVRSKQNENKEDILLNAEIPEIANNEHHSCYISSDSEESLDEYVNSSTKDNLGEYILTLMPQ